MTYKADEVRLEVERDRERLFASYSSNRPPNWSCDLRTRDVVCLSVWLDEELTRLGLDDLGRRTQTNQFNRFSRSEDDVFELAARIMNDAVAGDIDRHRRPHRRWG